MVQSSRGYLVFMLLVLTVKQDETKKFKQEFPLRRSYYPGYTGFGTLIGNCTANSKTSKLVTVDERMKQRVLVQFLHAEKMSRKEIETQLKRWFGNETLDLDEKESPEEIERRRKLHYHVVERVIIQYLSQDGIRPSEIYRRMRQVSSHGQHLCNVYRWAHKFKAGRTDVANQRAEYNRSRGRQL